MREERCRLVPPLSEASTMDALQLRSKDGCGEWWRVGVGRATAGWKRQSTESSRGSLARPSRTRARRAGMPVLPVCRPRHGLCLVVTANLFP